MLRALSYIAVFMTGAILGGMFPGYSAQYQHRLYAQFDQLATDLEPFQEISDRYHGGSLAALIQYHLDSNDPTFYAEGLAIQQMVDGRAILAEARAALDASFFRQAWYLYSNSDTALASATWAAYTPGFVATREAILFALSIGLAFCVVWYLIWAMLRFGLQRRFVGKSA